jgi:hypothetical protein
LRGLALKQALLFPSLMLLRNIAIPVMHDDVTKKGICNRLPVKRAAFFGQNHRFRSFLLGFRTVCQGFLETVPPEGPVPYALLSSQEKSGKST